MKKWTKYSLVALSSVAGILVAVVVVLYFLMQAMSGNPFGDRKFDRNLWQSCYGSNSQDNPRGQMFDDLRKNYLRKSMSKAEVIALMGKPDYEDGAEFISYKLGYWSGFRIDLDTLDLRFNKEGKLRKFYRVQH
jgi:hypothetical protein